MNVIPSGFADYVSIFLGGFHPFGIVLEEAKNEQMV
jgi:hypothetical protein